MGEAAAPAKKPAWGRSTEREADAEQEVKTKKAAAPEPAAEEKKEDDEDGGGWDVAVAGKKKKAAPAEEAAPVIKSAPWKKAPGADSSSRDDWKNKGKEEAAEPAGNRPWNRK